MVSMPACSSLLPNFDTENLIPDEGQVPVAAEARELKLTSDEHFTVDGTLIEPWASFKSLRHAVRLGPRRCERFMISS
jgi:hypothetical protein